MDVVGTSVCRNVACIVWSSNKMLIFADCVIGLMYFHVVNTNLCFALRTQRLFSILSMLASGEELFYKKFAVKITPTILFGL